MAHPSVRRPFLSAEPRPQRRRWAAGFAGAFLLWYLAVIVGAGGLGAALNCEGGEGCFPGSPSWTRPWTWGDYSVFPEALLIGVVGLIPAVAFVALVTSGRRLPAFVAFVLSLVFLSYPFFAGLTQAGRVLFAFGVLLGIAAIGAAPAPTARTSTRAV